MQWFKIYRLQPPRKFGDGARVVDESIVITSDPDRAIALFKREIEACEAPTLARASIDHVYLSVQSNPDPKARGRIVYRSVSSGKVGRSKISHNDNRIVLPATREYGKLVASSWPWHPRFINGVPDLVASGDITQEQADLVLSERTHEDLREASRALERKTSRIAA